MKWFYHAAETEGTAEGGGRVEDIHMPVRASYGSDSSDTSDSNSIDGNSSDSNSSDSNSSNSNSSDSNSSDIKDSIDSINGKRKD